MKGKVKEQWGKLTDDDLTAINGQRDQLEGKVQERYGIAKDEAKEQLDAGGQISEEPAICPYPPADIQWGDLQQTSHQVAPTATPSPPAGSRRWDLVSCSPNEPRARPQRARGERISPIRLVNRNGHRVTSMTRGNSNWNDPSRSGVPDCRPRVTRSCSMRTLPSVVAAC